MLPFFVRFFLFCVIWGLIFFSQLQQTGVFLLFFCAFSLTIFFLIPLFKGKFVLFGILELLTLLYAFMFEEKLLLLFLFLILLYCFESAFYITPLKYRINLVAITLILLSCFIFIMRIPWMEICGYFILTLLLSLVLSYLNTIFIQSLSRTNLYEELLGEYRRVKRSAMRAENAARMEERTRIAREMHDSVGHKLTALSMQIEMLLLKEENELLHTMKRTVNESLEETRKAVRSLTLEDIEGISSVIHLIRKLESESQLRIHFTVRQGTLNLPLSNQYSIVLYRVLQESLTNAMKYGTSSREVFVTLGGLSIGQLSFEIKNKYDSTKPFHEGFGLRSMRKRVEDIGGSLLFYQVDDHFVTEGIIPVEVGKG